MNIKFFGFMKKNLPLTDWTVCKFRILYYLIKTSKQKGEIVAGIKFRGLWENHSIQIMSATFAFKGK